LLAGGKHRLRLRHYQPAEVRLDRRQRLFVLALFDEPLAKLETAGKRQAPAHDRAILTLMAYTALRTVEVHRTETGKLVLTVQGKGRRSKDEIVVIDNPEAVEALYAWLAQRGDAPGPLFTSMSDRNKAGSA
jgi:integrase